MSGHQDIEVFVCMCIMIPNGFPYEIQKRQQKSIGLSCTPNEYKCEPILWKSDSMTDCDSPRCFHVKERCQCPNSWIEYLSKEAKDRRNSGLPRLSIKRHATNYRKLKRSGKFKTGKPTKECRDIDTDTLCKWNSQRRPSTRESSADLEAFLKMKDPSIRDMPGEPRIKTGAFKGVPVIIKIEDVGNEQDDLRRKNFLYTTKVHTLMTERIPRSVPKLYKAYFLQSPTGLRGIHIMEHLSGVMIDDYLKGQCDLPSLARALKKLLDDLRSCGVIHRDLSHNIMLTLSRHGRVIDAKALDFENTHLVNKVSIENMEILFEGLSEDPPFPPPALLLELLKIDRSLPREMKDWETYDFPLRVDEKSQIRKYNELPNPEVFFTRNHV